jgi:hypothetical protein
MHLQSLVLALGGAGLGTCRAAAAIKQTQDLILIWIAARLDTVLPANSFVRRLAAPTLADILEHLRIAVLSRNTVRQQGASHMLLTNLMREVVSGRYDISMIIPGLKDALTTVVQGGGTETCSLLLQHLPSKAAPELYSMSVREAANCGQYDIIQLVLGYISEPYVKAAHVRSAILRTSCFRHFDALERLVRNHASRRDKQLLLEAGVGDWHLVWLLKNSLRGEHPSCCDNNGPFHSPYLTAAQIAGVQRESRSVKSEFAIHDLGLKLAEVQRELRSRGL